MEARLQLRNYGLHPDEIPAGIDREPLDSVYFAPAESAKDEGIYVLTTAVNTGCTSGWHGRRYQLNYVDVAKADSILMLDEDLFAFVLDGDRRAKLSRNELEIDYTGNSFDPRKIPFRDQLRLYRLDGNTATPIPEASADAEDFTETWLNSTWKTSAARTAKGSMSRLEVWYHRLRRYLSVRARIFLSSFAPATPCRDDPKLWQYGVIFGQLKKDVPRSDVDTQPRVEKKQANGSVLFTGPSNVLPWLRPSFARPQFAYFLAREDSPHLFTMVDIRKTPRPGCPIATD